MMRILFVIGLVLLIGFLAWLITRRNSEMPQTSVPLVSPVAIQNQPQESTPTVIPSESPVAAPPLGELVEFKPRVTFRRYQELLWQEAFLKLSLFAFDAVYTHRQAGALIQVSKRSEISLDEETLLILNPAHLEQKVVQDRAVMRNGSLTGNTTSELMLLTSAALLRIRPKSKSGFASTRVSLKEGKKLSVKLNEGEGFLYKTRKPGEIRIVETIPLIQKRTVVIAAPLAPDRFGLNPDDTKWPDPPRQVGSLSSATPGFLEVIEPADYTRTNQSYVQVRGRVSDPNGVVNVNGERAMVDRSASFLTRVPLRPGSNTILVEFVPSIGPPQAKRIVVMKGD